MEVHTRELVPELYSQNATWAARAHRIRFVGIHFERWPICRRVSTRPTRSPSVLGFDQQRLGSPGMLREIARTRKGITRNSWAKRASMHQPDQARLKDRQSRRGQMRRRFRNPVFLKESEQ